MPTSEMVEWATEPVESTDWTTEEDRPATEFPGADLDAEIRQAKKILQLPDDWDGQGSPRYSAVVLDRATAFLATHLREVWERFGVSCSIPKIGPGPDGSIDLHWKRPSWELLVNIPADGDAMAAFYGDNYGTQKIKGSLDPRKFNLGIATWLMN
jgi:hypothetical protein